MFFHKRIDRAVDVMNERNKKYLDAHLPEERRDEPPELEKGDLPAVIISALIVFGPIILGLGLLLALAWILLS